MRVKFWVFIRNCGDGSASALFYKTKEEAEAASKKDNDTYGENFCEDVYESYINVDLATGKMI